MSISMENVRADTGRKLLPNDWAQSNRELAWDESREDHEAGQFEYLATIWETISPQNRLQLIRSAVELSKLSEANAELDWEDQTRREPAIGSTCPEESLMDFEAAMWFGATRLSDEGPVVMRHGFTRKQRSPKLDHQAIANAPGTAKEVAKRFGCSAHTVYSIRKEMRGKS